VIVSCIVCRLGVLATFWTGDWAGVAALVGIWMVVSKTIWSTFERLEVVASPEARAATTKWLLGFKGRQWSGTRSFRAVWNEVVGFAAPRRRRVPAVIILALLGETVGWTVLSFAGEDLSMSPLRASAAIAMAYLAILKTEWVIARLPKSASTGRLVRVDLGLSLAFAATCAVVAFTKLLLDTGLDVSLAAYVALLKTPEVYVGVLTGTFMSTASALMFVLAGIALKASQSASVTLRVLNVEKKPFVSLGAMTVVILSLLVFVPAAIVLAFM
jgi:hypothetical protein